MLITNVGNTKLYLEYHEEWDTLPWRVLSRGWGVEELSFSSSILTALEVFAERQGSPYNPNRSKNDFLNLTFFGSDTSLLEKILMSVDRVEIIQMDSTTGKTVDQHIPGNVEIFYAGRKDYILKHEHPIEPLLKGDVLNVYGSLGRWSKAYNVVGLILNPTTTKIGEFYYTQMQVGNIEIWETFPS